MNFSLRHFQDHYGTAIPRDQFPNSAFSNSSVRQHDTEISVAYSKGSYNRRIRGETRNDSRATPNGEECRDWLKGQFDQIPVGEISQDAGCTKRAAENIRAGENGIRMEFLVALCRNNPLFRADFFAFCGGKLENDPEFVAGITMALNSLSRRQT